MNKFIFSCALLTSTFTMPGFAGEVDHYTHREEPLRDSRDILNEMANKDMVIALKKVNKNTLNCNEEALYKELRKYFGNHLLGKFTKEAIGSDEIDKHDTSIYRSVYRDWKFWDGSVMASPIVKQLNMGMSPLINLGGIEIGMDKFEHLFGQGFYYFTLKNTEHNSLYEMMYKGTHREMFDMGGSRLQTGIMSFGDLSANFNGLRFWNHVLLKEDDVLGAEYNKGPFIKCQNNQWVKKTDIDFANYFDDTADESINCSTFANESILKKFSKRIAELGYTCPMNIEKRESYREKYGKFARWIINSGGNAVTTFSIGIEDTLSAD